MPNSHIEGSPELANKKSTAPDLSQRIIHRIHKRIGDRIHNLMILVSPETIELQGQCATFYTKQLAQEAVLGVLEDELLVNHIEVGHTEASTI